MATPRSPERSSSVMSGSTSPEIPASMKLSITAGARNPSDCSQLPTSVGDHFEAGKTTDIWKNAF
jgi:hypothetical protein